MMADRKRVLFVAEAVTLAHVARPTILARALDRERFEIHFACAPGSEFVYRDAGFITHTIHSIPAAQFRDALAKGDPLYDYATLDRYRKEDLELLDRVKPDFVVGDFRLSLAVSAAQAKVPYANITNAHWSPYAPPFYPLPEHPMIKVFGVAVSEVLFKLARPAVFAFHARALNRLRRDHGLSPLGSLRAVYTEADHTLYGDVPGLIPTTDLPPNHHYIGPLNWSPDIPRPDWWDRLPKDSPKVYVTFGSSGQVELLPGLVAALADLAPVILVATAGRCDATQFGDGVWAADYLPGSEAIRRCDLVVCNGGSAQVYQSLAEGVPVLGIASNMDQYSTMGYVERQGSGILMRAGRCNAAAVASEARRLLAEPGFKAAARAMATEFASYDPAAILTDLIDS